MTTPSSTPVPAAAAPSAPRSWASLAAANHHTYGSLARKSPVTPQIPAPAPASSAPLSCGSLAATDPGWWDSLVREPRIAPQVPVSTPSASRTWGSLAAIPQVPAPAPASSAPRSCGSLDDQRWWGPVVQEPRAAPHVPVPTPSVSRTWGSLAAIDPDWWDAAVAEESETASQVPAPVTASSVQRSWGSLAATEQEWWDSVAEESEAASQVPAPATSSSGQRLWVWLNATDQQARPLNRPKYSGLPRNDHSVSVNPPLTSSNPPPPPKPSHQVRTGLCVVCQDEEADIVIIDCGHLAMCKSCSDLVMKSSRKCPLCRTPITAQSKLLRVFKT